MPPAPWKWQPEQLYQSKRRLPSAIACALPSYFAPFGSAGGGDPPPGNCVETAVPCGEGLSGGACATFFRSRLPQP
jgi:hypothetical protein